MTAADLGRTSHQALINAAPAAVYALIADASRWPLIFGPTISVEYLARRGNEEKLQLWAFTDEKVRSWVSRRKLEPGARRIGFWRERSQPPTQSMSGEWTVEDAGDDRSLVTLRHAFSAVDNDPAGLRWITEATNHNSERELAALAETAETGRNAPYLTFDFADSVQVSAAAAAVYGFVYRADLWPDRLPHVSRLELREDTPNQQVMTMETIRQDGSPHTTRSVRLCVPEVQITYKQLVTPALLSGHLGEWSFADTPEGATVTSRHTVTVNPAAIPDVLGPDADLDLAKSVVRERIGANSRVTLAHAKSHAESETSGRQSLP